MSKKKRVKPWADVIHPEWGERISTRTKFLTAARLNKKIHEVEGSNEVIQLNIARHWVKDGRLTITYYTVNLLTRRWTSEKVYKQIPL